MVWKGSQPNVEKCAVIDNLPVALETFNDSDKRKANKPVQIIPASMLPINPTVWSSYRSGAQKKGN